MYMHISKYICIYIYASVGPEAPLRAWIRFEYQATRSIHRNTNFRSLCIRHVSADYSRSRSSIRVYFSQMALFWVSFYRNRKCCVVIAGLGPPVLAAVIVIAPHAHPSHMYISDQFSFLFQRFSFVPQLFVIPGR